jgi:hypothetical protein
MVTNTHPYAYRIFLCIALFTRSSVADPLCHFYADPDPACHFDPIRILPFTLLRIRIIPSFQIKTQNLGKVLK